MSGLALFGLAGLGLLGLYVYEVISTRRWLERQDRDQRDKP